MGTQGIEITRTDVDVVAFDWDGTLVNTVGPKLLHNQRIAKRFGRELSIEEVRGIWKETSDFPELMFKLTGCRDHDRIMSVVKEGYNNPSFAKRHFEEFNVAEFVTGVRGLGFLCFPID